MARGHVEADLHGEESNMEALQYPIGRFHWDNDSSAIARKHRIERIAALPAELRAAVTGLSDGQLDTPYRPGGWTLRQVAHHLGDSHMNSYCRFKFAVTEDAPSIKVYDEQRWAETTDAKSGPVSPTLTLLEGLHHRWVAFLRSLDDNQWSRVFVHPEMGETSLDKALALYAWHSAHHLRHITMTREREDW